MGLMLTQFMRFQNYNTNKIYFRWFLATNNPVCKWLYLLLPHGCKVHICQKKPPVCLALLLPPLPGPSSGRKWLELRCQTLIFYLLISSKRGRGNYCVGVAARLRGRGKKLRMMRCVFYYSWNLSPGKSPTPSKLTARVYARLKGAHATSPALNQLFVGRQNHTNQCLRHHPAQGPHQGQVSQGPRDPVEQPVPPLVENVLPGSSHQTKPTNDSLLSLKEHSVPLQRFCLQQTGTPPRFASAFLQLFSHFGTRRACRLPTASLRVYSERRRTRAAAMTLRWSP